MIPRRTRKVSDYRHHREGRMSGEQSRELDDDISPRLVPIFPPGPFTPKSRCQHAPIEFGSPFYCPICHASGRDYFPTLTPLNESLTRMERRALRFVH
jgi:hypothetical protein